MELKILYVTNAFVSGLYVVTENVSAAAQVYVGCFEVTRTQRPSGGNLGCRSHHRRIGRRLHAPERAAAPTSPLLPLRPAIKSTRARAAHEPGDAFGRKQNFIVGLDSFRGCNFGYQIVDCTNDGRRVRGNPEFISALTYISEAFFNCASHLPRAFRHARPACGGTVFMGTAQTPTCICV